MTFRNIYIASVLFLISIPFSADAQKKSEPDTLNLHSPKKAVILSAVLPGAGQAYNRKYWKMPIVYAGLGVSTYFIINNNRNYQRYRTEYLIRINGDGTPDPDLALYSDGNLLEFIDTYRGWRDLSFIAFGAVYFLQIIDAAVDAHFYYWDKKIGEDLSFRFAPSIDPYNNTLGLKLSLKL